MPKGDVAAAPRVVLVDPYMAREDPMERKFVELYPSLSLLTLAGYLREHGASVRIVDLTFDRDLRALEQVLRSHLPHIIGVHTKTLTFERSRQIAGIARTLGIASVAGGPDSATNPSAYLDAGFDAVVLGEGEATIVELAAASRDQRPIHGIPGVVSRVSGRTERGPIRPFLRDLDSLPMPAWDLLEMERYLDTWEASTGERRAAVLTSRGCPFDCSWCSKPTFGRTFRQQSPSRVIEELVALKDRYRVDYVRFCDDVFGIDRRWIEELLDRMIGEDLALKFECLARVDLLKPDLLARMRRAGLQRVYVGVESGSQKMLDVMNRGTRLAQVEQAADCLRREGIRQFWFLMLGYPGESLEDIEATLTLFRRFSPEEYSVSIAVPVPGTRFHDLVKDRLTEAPRATPGNGGHSLLFEGAYPETLYRWEQARFGWEAALGRAKGKLSPEVIQRLSQMADELDIRVARPVLAKHPRPKTTGPIARMRSYLPHWGPDRRPHRPAGSSRVPAVRRPAWVTSDVDGAR